MKPFLPFVVTLALNAGCATSQTASSTSRDAPGAVSAVASAASAPIAVPERAVGHRYVSLRLNETQVARYTTVSTQPDEADGNPLALVVKVHFPREMVSTVGDAVRYLLIRTGYQLSDVSDSDAQRVFAMRLPDHQRVLGPYRVDVILGVLMGPTYQLQVDARTRSISYAAQVGVAPAAVSSASAPGASIGMAAGTETSGAAAAAPAASQSTTGSPRPPGAPSQGQGPVDRVTER